MALAEDCNWTKSQLMGGVEESAAPKKGKVRVGFGFGLFSLVSLFITDLLYYVLYYVVLYSAVLCVNRTPKARALRKTQCCGDVRVI